MTESIGKRIERLRKSKGLTQKQLADLIGMSQQAFAALEKRDTAPKKLYEISMALGVTPSYIHTGKNDTQKMELRAHDEEAVNGYTSDEIEEVVPIALERTITALSKQFQAQGLGKLDIVKHQDLIANFLGASIVVELSGDYEKIANKFLELKTLKSV
ncbi:MULTISPECIES: helix-turn-helix transcriptional regulator [unclassified Pseudoalteromonas]|uniref:helix-turn-helix transcriptional regulator n=1 Tax=unclassified Pseudoalteromonas TaxID=194690 RepID=UPI001F2F496A|nr:MULTISPECIES: helix-turn-helix transcriptional regulator [unclassified Pseudoalteromonas]MCF2827106.1 helix-turn-helix domain-containing protein [Pseudoalteromonas sp. OF5H-5]MCF2834249.1 helix-turn-helix domain-containing protein [Pseudoalteromonas sp. DL2-H6]MCF2925881.1 helix-turn-helix domain-containing protein [Pseudoalteromonas sp. DL2-H1]